MGRLASLLCLAMLASGAPTAAAEEKKGDAEEQASLARAEAYTRLMRSVIAARSGDAERAAEEIREAVALQPQSTDLLYEGADILYWAGRRAEGEKLARRVLEIDPDHLQALRFVADRTAEQALGGQRSAESLHESVRLYEDLERRGASPDPHVLEMLTRLKIEAKDLDGAIQSVTQLVALRPGDLMASRTLAQLLLRGGKEREALRVILRFLVGHPAEQELLNFSEQLAQGLDAWDLVEEELAGGWAPSENSAGMLKLQGEARLRLGRAADAAQSLERAMAADPSARPVRMLLGRAYREMRRYANAAELFEGLVAEDPRDAEARLDLAQTLEDQRDAAGAVESYAAGLGQLVGRERASELRDQIRRRMASLLLGAGRKAQARELLAQLEQHEHPEALELEVRLALADKDYTAARQAARRLRSVDQAALGALLEGEIALLEKRGSKAEAHFAEAIGVLGPVVRRRVASLYLEAGKPELGASILREAVAKSPEDADARFHLGDFLYQAKRIDEAEHELREVLRLNPRHGPALNYLGYSFAERDIQLEEALVLVQRALETDVFNGMYLDSLGWVYYRMGRFGEAREPLERAAREMPKDPTVLEHLGDVYQRLGERELALSAWTRALDAGADDADALQRKIGHERGLAAEAPHSSAPPAQPEAPVEGRLDSPPLPRPR